MRTSLLICFIVVASQALADEPPRRDPTIPGVAAKSPAPLSTDDSPALPDIRIKAMVFQNEDHGSAIIAIGQRNIRLKLHREKPTQFAFDGVEYQVVDFDSQSLRIESDTRSWLVH